MRKARIDGEQAQEVTPNANGALEFVLPWQPGRRAKARVEWSDASYDLTIDAASGKMERVVRPAVRQACEQLERRHVQLVEGARSTQRPVTRRDVQHFPLLGRCEMAGDGAWALAVEELKATGEGRRRQVSVALSVVHVDQTGASTRAPHGTLAFSPGRLRVPPLMVYDYDADGSPELIIRYDILARPEGRRDAPLAARPPVFTYKQGKLAPYTPAGVASGGGVLAQQLDPDMRPDVGGYGPFMGWLGEDCGVGQCPERIVGPRFFRHSLPDGTFRTDERTDQVLRRACSARPERLFETPPRSAADKQRAAMSVACALVRGATGTSIAAELRANRTKLCEADSNCELLRTLLKWANSTPPRVLQP